ncbi:PKD domain-containing protein [Lewinella sp. IMCC34183]|uniref:PKD domain-containing protein n=1 Tax=Lewinella sp. IMCC34183 TaxID=2248762 RepID=UPI0013008585|nr:PKD domain-containing protein [Lewinella sp. IMCC34183]
MRIYTLLVVLLMGTLVSGQTSAPTPSVWSGGAYAIADAGPRHVAGGERAATAALPIIPDIEINSNLPVCYGGQIMARFTEDAPSDLTYSWRGPRGWSSRTAEWTRFNADPSMAGTYTLTVTDRSGRSASKRFTVTVKDPVEIAITPEPAIACLGQNLVLRATGGRDYEWSGPHLSRAGEDSVIFRHIVPGQYPVTVVGKELNGECTGTETILVTLQPAPKVNAGDDYVACSNLELQLTGSPDASDGGSGQWSGSNVTPDGRFTATAPGTYSATYTYTNEYGCRSSDRATMCVDNPPVADFEFEQGFVCKQEDETFRTINTTAEGACGAGVSYLWEFVGYDGGDCNNGKGQAFFTAGTDRNSREPVFRITKPGSYIISLIASSDCGSTEHRDTMLVFSKPAAEIEVEDMYCGAQFLDFGFSKLPCHSSMSTTRWEFPTASPPVTYVGADAPPVYFEPGTHTMTVVTSNKCGGGDFTHTFEVMEPPVADYMLPSDTVCRGDTIIPIDNSEGTHLTYLWEASDTAIHFIDSSLATPQIAFTNSLAQGWYTLTATLTNEACGTSRQTIDVYVELPPRPSIRNPGPFCETASFTPEGTYGIPFESVDSFRWELSDGTTTTLLSTTEHAPPVSIDRPGTYTLLFTAVNRCERKTARRSFRVLETPDPAFDLSRDTVCTDGANSITLTDRSGGDIDTYAWEVTNSAGQVVLTSGEASPTFTFPPSTPPGNYTLAVTVANPVCPDTPTWDTTVLVVTTPKATIAAIDNNCADHRFTPRADYGTFGPFIDSVRWTFPAGSTPATSTDREPGEVFVDRTGRGLPVTLTVYGGCGSSSDTVRFDILEPPVAEFSIDSLICRGGDLVPVNSSTGEDLTYRWTASPDGVTISDSTVREPRFTFGGTATAYVLILEVGNATCGFEQVSHTVTITRAPQPQIATIPDACEDLDLLPSVTYGVPAAEIDSVRWTLARIGGATPAAELYRGPETAAPFRLDAPGLYEFTATAYNICAPTGRTARRTFRIYTPARADFDVNDLQLCRGEELIIQNTSDGDVTSFTVTVLDPAGTQVLSSSDARVVVGFDDSYATGSYTVRLEATNPACGPTVKDTVVWLSAPPTVTLDPVSDACGTTSVALSASFSDPSDIDSVGWQITQADGTVVFHATTFSPASVSLPPGRYTAEVTVTNDCGTDTKRDNFQLFEPPFADVALSVTELCAGEPLTVTNTSTGDVSSLMIEVIDPSGAVAFISTSSPASFAFTETQLPGTYTVRLAAGNIACGMDTTEQTLRFNRTPTIILNQVVEGCGRTTVTLSGTTSAPAFIDSIGWQITDAAGTVVYTHDSYSPAPVSLAPGRYAVEATVTNECGATTARDTFRLWETPEPAFTLDTDLVCESGSVTAVNTSGGDVSDLSFDVLDASGATVFTRSVSPATFVFDGSQPEGDYTLRMTVSNPECGTLIRDTTVRITVAPTITLDPIADACGRTTVTLSGKTSAPAFIDSIGWEIRNAAGVLVYDHDSFHPAPVSLEPGTYHVRAGVRNGCGSDEAFDTFQLFAAPQPLIALNADTVCRGGSITATDVSGGDVSGRVFQLVDPNGVIVRRERSSPAVLTFENDWIPGDYTLQLFVGNPECGTERTDTIVHLSAPPTIVLDSIADACGRTTVQLAARTSDVAFIDGIDWRIMDAAGTVVYRNSTFMPGPVNLPVGTYRAEAAVRNTCGVDTSRTAFRLYEMPEPAFTVDAAFVCVGGAITAENTSAGDITDFTFEVLDATNIVVFTSNASPASFTFTGAQPIGDYTVRLSVSNPQCGTLTRDTTIRLSAEPTIVLDPAADNCAPGTVQLSATTSDVAFIDSIGWQITDASGTIVYANSTFTPGPVNLPAGIYAVEATVLNSCGSDTSRDTFQLFETPEPSLALDTDLVCQGGTITATNTSAGDVTDFTFQVIDATSNVVFTSNASPASLTFTGAQPIGDYTVRLSVSNPQCGTLTRDTTIRLSAEPTIVLDPVADNCAPGTVQLSATTSDVAFIDSIGWSITDASGVVVYTNSTFTPASVNLPAGIYAVEATVLNSCGSDTSRDTFQLFETPEPSLALDTDLVCQGGTITATNTSAGDVTDFTFTVVDGSGATIFTSNASPASFTFTGAQPIGDYTVRLSVSNPQCGTLTRDTTIRLSAEPTIVLDPVADDCSPGTVQLSATTSDVAFIDSIGWIITDASGVVVYTNSTFTPASVNLPAGIYAVEATVLNSCGSDTSRDTFQLFETPEPSLALDTDLVCQGGTITATNTSAGDVTDFTFQVIDATSNVVFTSNTSPASFTFSGAQPIGDYTVRLSVSNPQCGTLTRDTTIRLSAEPTIVLDPVADDCAPGTVQLSATTSDVAFIDSIGWQITDASGTIVYTNSTFTPASVSLPAGIYAVEATVLNSCGSDTSRDTFQLFETPEPSLALDADLVCQGGTITATNTSAGDVTDFTFQVIDATSNVVFTSNASPASLTFTGAQPIGDYTVRLSVSNPQCGTLTRDTTIRLSAEPTIVLDPAADYCAPGTVQLSATTSDVAFIDSIGWSITDASGVVVYTNSTFTPASVNLPAGTYAVEATVLNSCGSDTSRDTFQLFETPEPSLALDTDLVCQGGTITATNISAGDVTDFTFQVIDATSNVVFTSNVSPASFTFTGAQPIGDYTVRLSVSNPQCGTLTRDTTIRLSAEPTIVLDPAADNCAPGTVQLSATTSDVAFIDSIGWQITDASGTIVYANSTFTPGPVNLPAGIYAVEATVLNSCGSDTSRDTFQLFETPEPSLALDTDLVCQGGTITATNTSAGDVTDFTFQVIDATSNVVFTSNASPASFTFTGAQPIGDYTVRLSVSNPQCGTLTRDTTIRLSAEPTIVLDPVADDCAPGTVQLSATTSDVAFIDSIGWQITDASGTIVYTNSTFTPASVNLPAGVYAVEATVLNSCGSDTSRDTFQLFETPEPSLALDTDLVCQGGTITATNTSAGDVTDFTFTVVDGSGATIFTSNASPASFTFTGAQPIGDYTVRLSVSNPQCGTLTRDTTIRLSAEPTIVLDPVADDCSPGTVQLSATTSDVAFIDSIGWIITDASGVVVYTNSTFTPASVNLPAGIYAVEATVLNSCGSDTSRDTFQLFETLEPSLALDADLVCQGGTITATNTSAGDVTDFTFQVLDAANNVVFTSNTSPASFTFTGAQPIGDYTVRLSVSNPQCGTLTRDTTIRLSAEPTIVLDPVADDCAPGTVQLSATTSDVDFIDSIGWQITDASGTIVYANSTFTPNAVNLPAGTYAVEATVLNSCGSDTSRDTFQLFETPAPSFVIDAAQVCQGGSIVLTNTSLGDVTDFTFEVLDASGTVLDRTDASPATFNFSVGQAPGDYTVRMSVSNPQCGTLTRDTIVRLSAPPTIVLNPVADDCAPGTVQLSATTSDVAFIDSIGWSITDASGAVVFTNATFTPGPVNLPAGTYAVEATVLNSCGSDTSRDTFRLFETPEPSFTLDTDLLCGTGTLTATTTSGGDATAFTFTVRDAAGATVFSSDVSPATFTFDGSQAFGDYTVELAVTNPACGTVRTDTTVTYTTAPTIALEPQPDHCGPTDVQLAATLTHAAEADSVTWVITDETGTERFAFTGTAPASARLTPGTYAVAATVANACGVHTDRDTFRIFTAPTAGLALSTDLLCSDRSFTVINSSTGDADEFRFTVHAADGTEVLSSTNSPTTFTFADNLPYGDYTVRLTAGNAVCGTVTRDTTVRLSAAPAIALDPVVDACGTTEIQLSATTTDTAAMDRIDWWIVDATGTEVYASTTFRPDAVTLPAGTYAVAATVTNACGTAVDRDTFRIYDDAIPDFTLDADLVCGDGTLTASSNTADPRFEVLDASGTPLFSSNTSPATFTFGPEHAAGTYTLRLTTGNPVCGFLQRDTIVRRTAAPSIALDRQPDYCGTAEVLLAATLTDTTFTDSLIWTIRTVDGGVVYTHAGPDPVPTTLAPGHYAVDARVANACGTDVDRDTFRVYAPPVPRMELTGELVCADRSLTVTEASAGDVTDFTISVLDASGTPVMTRTKSPARFAFAGSLPDGTYTIRLEAGNPACGSVVRDTIITLVTPPTIVLDAQPDYCGTGDVQLSAVTSDPAAIDSIGWSIRDAAGTAVFTHEGFRPDPVTLGPGTYAVEATVANACATDRSRDTFRILESVVLDVTLDSSLNCALPFAVPVTNRTTGDDLTFDWTVAGPGVTAFDRTAREPNFEFTTAGTYVVTLTASSPACGISVWRDTLTARPTPQPTLADLTEYCGDQLITPGIDYDGTVADSVRWDFPGSDRPTSTELFPADVGYRGAGTFRYGVNIYTACGETRLEDSFVIDTMPVIDLGPRDTVCTEDGPFTLTTPTPAGGQWRDALGRAGVITADGTFDPAAAGAGTTTVEYVYTSGACETVARREIHVIDLSYVTLTATELEMCESETAFPLTVGSPAGGWYTGTGVTDTSGVFSAELAGPGDHELTYHYREAGGSCTTERTFTVHVWPRPRPAIELPATICQGQPTQLTHRGAHAVSFLWELSDGRTSEEENPTFTFTGTRTVTLTTTSDQGCTTTVIREVNVTPAPFTRFMADMDKACPGEEITFTNMTDARDATTYRWDFGDGTTSLEDSPRHAFANPDATVRKYFVVLTATNACGSSTSRMPVFVYPEPELSFTTDGGECVSETVTFTAQANRMTDLRWDFGDGTTAAGEENPSHTFPAPGTYTVTLTGTSVAGDCPATYTTELTVGGGPTASFTADTYEGCAPLPVELTNTSTGDGPYFWDFGDGTTSTEVQPGTHVYDTPGDYTVTLRTEGRAGCGTGVVTVPIRVHGVPEAAFVAEPFDACAIPQEVYFNNDSRGAVDYSWDFGNGQTSDLEEVAVLYDERGTYSVNLTATSDYGCSTTEALEFTVYEPPVAALDVLDTVVCGPLTLPFVNGSSWSDYFDWEFSDGYTADVAELERSFSRSGNYSVQLVAGNAIGCTDTLTVENIVTVLPTPTADFDYVEDQVGGTSRLTFESLASEDAVVFGWDFGDGQFSDLRNPTHDFESPEGTTVKHWVENEFGCVDSLALPLDLDEYGGLYIPNILTPVDNTIAEQDIFKPKGLNLTDYYIAIYTRTGQLVWESMELDERGSPTEHWDGTYQGKPMMAGTYVWRVHRAEFRGGKPWIGMRNANGRMSHTGYLTLVR